MKAKTEKRGKKGVKRYPCNRVLKAVLVCLKFGIVFIGLGYKDALRYGYAQHVQEFALRAHVLKKPAKAG